MAWQCRRSYILILRLMSYVLCLVSEPVDGSGQLVQVGLGVAGI
jgi:hypothetical protein